jgi:hypothetical protein
MSEQQDDPIRALIKEKKNRSKVGQIREQLPAIQEAHAAGVSLERIVEALQKMGIDVTYSYLKTMLYRIRKKEAGAHQKVIPVGANPLPTNEKQKIDGSTSTKEDMITQIEQENLTPKQRREKIANLFINETKISPRIQRILEKKNESSSN